MIISLHTTTQISSPNTAAATSIPPLDPSGSSKKIFPKPEQIFIRQLPTTSLQRLKLV